MVPDEVIHGTLNVGSSAPVALEAFAFIAAIAVDPVTLALLVLIGAAKRWARRQGRAVAAVHSDRHGSGRASSVPPSCC